jgi:hypothetical protein
MVAWLIRYLSVGSLLEELADEDSGLELAIGAEMPPDEDGVAPVAVVWEPDCVWEGVLPSVAEAVADEPPEPELSDAATNGFDELPPVPVVKSKLKLLSESCWEILWL